MATQKHVAHGETVEQLLGKGDPASCVNALDGPSGLDVSKNDYAWMDLTYLLHKANVSWAYYLSEGHEPDCADDVMLCQARPQLKSVPAI